MNGLTFDLEPFFSKGGPGYDWAKGAYKDGRGSYNNGWSALDAGLYHAAVFTQHSAHLSPAMLHNLPIKTADHFGSKFDVLFETTPFTSSAAPPLGFRIYHVLIEVERGLPCPAHSVPDVYDVYRPELVDGSQSTAKKRCRCTVGTAPGDLSYMAMGPADKGYDPDYPQCVVADVDRVRPCDRGWTCGHLPNALPLSFCSEARCVCVFLSSAHQPGPCQPSECCSMSAKRSCRIYISDLFSPTSSLTVFLFFSRSASPSACCCAC